MLSGSKLTLGGVTETSVGRLVIGVSRVILGRGVVGTLMLTAVSKLIEDNDSDGSSGSREICGIVVDGRANEREESMLDIDTEMLASKPVAPSLDNVTVILLKDIAASIDTVGSKSEGLPSERAVSIEVVGNESEMLSSGSVVSIDGDDSDSGRPIFGIDVSIEGRFGSDDSPGLGSEVAERSVKSDTVGRSASTEESGGIVIGGAVPLDSAVAKRSTVIESGLDTE